MMPHETYLPGRFRKLERLSLRPQPVSSVRSMRRTRLDMFQLTLLQKCLWQHAVFGIEYIFLMDVLSSLFFPVLMKHWLNPERNQPW